MEKRLTVPSKSKYKWWNEWEESKIAKKYHFASLFLVTTHFWISSNVISIGTSSYKIELLIILKLSLSSYIHSFFYLCFLQCLEYHLIVRSLVRCILIIVIHFLFFLLFDIRLGRRSMTIKKCKRRKMRKT